MVHPGRSKSEFLSFLRVNDISLYVDTTVCSAVYLLMDLLMPVNDATMNMREQSVDVPAFSCFTYPKVEMLDPMVILF